MPVLSPVLAMRTLDREDPELGTVRLCRGCGEEWPKDPEFWYFQVNRHGKPDVMGRFRACWSERSRDEYGRRTHREMMVP